MTGSTWKRNERAALINTTEKKVDKQGALINAPFQHLLLLLFTFYHVYKLLDFLKNLDSKIQHSLFSNLKAKTTS